MVAPNVQQDVYSTGLTSTAAYVFTAAVKVYDADSFSLLVKHNASPGANSIDYKVQVATTTTTPSASDFADWISETVLASGSSFVASYDKEAFRWVRIGVQQNTAGESYNVGISTRREKVI